MEGDGDDGGVKTLKLRGVRSCVLVEVVPRFNLPSVDCYKVVDNGDSVDVVIEGKMAELPSPTRGTRFNHYVWIASGRSKTETKIEDGTLIVYSPAFKSSFPKKEIDLMSCDQVMKKIEPDLINFMFVGMGKFGRVVDPQDYKEMFNLDEDAAEGKEDEDEAAAAGNKGKEKEDEAATAVIKGKEKEAKKRKGKGKEAKKKRKRRSEEDEGEAKKEKQ